MASHVDAPQEVPVQPVPLSAEQQHWLEQAVALVDEDRLRVCA